MSSNNGHGSETFRGKASVYALEPTTKQWNDRGTSGTLIMYTPHIHMGTMKWTKNSHEIWWKIEGSKIKPKGERTWVMKATLLESDTKEIVALRFQDSTISNQFATKYREIFPISAPRPPPPPMSPPMIPPTMTQNLSIDAFYEDENQWICTVCTYTNSIDQLRCIMCGLFQSKSRNSTQQIVTRYNTTREMYQKQILDRKAKTELSVTGYCRNIEQMLNANILHKQHVIIPSGLIYLCSLFYVNIPWDFIVN
eukprot:183659_1